MIEEKSDNSGNSLFLETLECTNCGGTEKIVIKEDIVAPGDKVYPTGSVLCAKCKTPTMVIVYRWNKWKGPA